MTDLDRVSELFTRARKLPPKERAAFLSAECGDDAALRAEVELLLEHDGVGAFEQAEAAVIAGVRELDGDGGNGGDGPLPESVGDYRVIGVIGSGGMGVVYEAEQSRPQRRVALKMVRSGLSTDELLRRFEHEADVLGWLNHPGIARIFEAGTADAGAGPQPYFAMELVRGEPIHRFAEREQLGVPARLELIARVAEAVHHAHQKGVVHRDLKPANVLVDESGQPKVLDFGVARVTDSDLKTTTLLTRAGELVGTLPYMSPEQVSGDPAAVDTRSDVYALGVLTFELLTGRLPLEVGDDTPLPRAVQAIAEEEPTRLGSVDRSLRGDVETIVAKAIEKDRARRYSSALELAQDLRRYLNDEPIEARPPSTFYQLRKFARRNRAVAAGLVIAFGALSAATVVSTWMFLDADDAREAAELAEDEERKAKEKAQENLERALDAENDAKEAADLAGREADRANEEARRANREVVAANQVRRFLEDLFLEARSVDGKTGTRTVRELVDIGAERVKTSMYDSPSIRSDVLGMIGLVYGSLGLYEEAEPLLRESSEMASQLGEKKRKFYTVTLLRLGNVTRHLGDYEKAVGLFAKAIEVAESCEEDLIPERKGAHRQIGTILSFLGRNEEAQEQFDRGIELAMSQDVVDYKYIYGIRQGMAFNLRNRGDTDGCLQLMLEIEAGLQADGLDRTADFVRHLVSIADLLIATRQFDEAEERLLRAQEMIDDGVVEDHPDFLLIQAQLARIAVNRGDLEAAEKVFSQVLAQQRERGRGRHPEASVTLYELARILMATDRTDAAVTNLIEALDIVQERLGRDHKNRAPLMRDLRKGLLKLAGEESEEQPPAWEELLDRAIEVLEAGGHGTAASSLEEAVWDATEVGGE